MIQTILVMIASTAIFYFGFLLGYKVANKEEIKVENIKEKIPFTKANRELKEEIYKEEAIINKLNTLLHNINIYQGDDEGQRRIN